jgi:hypothetical protein
MNVQQNPMKWLAEQRSPRQTISHLLFRVYDGTMIIWVALLPLTTAASVGFSYQRISHATSQPSYQPMPEATSQPTSRPISQATSPPISKPAANFTSAPTYP